MVGSGITRWGTDGYGAKTSAVCGSTRNRFFIFGDDERGSSRATLLPDTPPPSSRIHLLRSGQLRKALIALSRPRALGTRSTSRGCQAEPAWGAQDISGLRIADQIRGPVR